ncbi:alkylphosphonate utilization protein, partial [Pseudomonas syringae]
MHGFTLLDARTIVSLPSCPKCNSEYTNADGSLLICPECAHEWSADAAGADASHDLTVSKDSTGNVLRVGDTVTVPMDSKATGSPLM